jgi:hypothetical protein
LDIARMLKAMQWWNNVLLVRARNKDFLLWSLRISFTLATWCWKGILHNIRTLAHPSAS